MKNQDLKKIDRILDIYTRLIEGKLVYKHEMAKKYGVNEKTVQRDLERIRDYLENQTAEDGIPNSLIYDHGKKGYRLEQPGVIRFSNEEILAITKILLDSRAFTKPEMMQMIDKLIECAVPKENQKLIYDLIANERYHYIEPRHKKVFLDKMWQIGQAIRECRVINIRYGRMKDKAIVERRLEPLAIMFSEYYFYVVGIIENIDKKKAFEAVDDPYPTIYRIDRIEKIEVLQEHYKIPYANRFEEGEFRKRVQFMYGGTLRKVKFKYTGESIEAVLDRLPTAKILSEEDGEYVVQAEVFGKGIDMWMRSQGDMVKLL